MTETYVSTNAKNYREPAAVESTFEKSLLSKLCYRIDKGCEVECILPMLAPVSCIKDYQCCALFKPGKTKKSQAANSWIYNFKMQLEEFGSALTAMQALSEASISSNLPGAVEANVTSSVTKKSNGFRKQ